MVPTNLVLIVVEPGRGTWDRQNQNKTLNNREIQHPSKFGDDKLFSPKRYKDQNDRIGEIYRLKRSLDRLYFENQVKSKDWVKNPVLSFPRIGQSAWWRSWSSTAASAHPNNSPEKRNFKPSGIELIAETNFPVFRPCSFNRLLVKTEWYKLIFFLDSLISINCSMKIGPTTILAMRSFWSLYFFEHFVRSKACWHVGFFRFFS